ncbi:MAG: RluA family pseudouridine synthase [Candidatus Cyclobacteriaceae bacterium M2_1C_046]
MKIRTLEPLIIHEDEHYIIVNKPPYVSSLQDRHDPMNMLSLAKSYHDDAQLAHRLDKETSGALVIAKNEEAYRNISIQFTDRKVEKVYHAVAEGVHEFRNKEVNLPIMVLSGQNKVRIGAEGKEAITYFNTLRTYFNYTLLECKPVTGRMHQIRIHLATLGGSISGDEQYGGKPFYLSAIKRKYHLKKETEEQPLIKRLALHAFSVAFTGLNGELISVEAPYPKDFAVLMKQLNKYG